MQKAGFHLQCKLFVLLEIVPFLHVVVNDHNCNAEYREKS